MAPNEIPDSVNLPFESQATDGRYAFSPTIGSVDGDVHQAWLELTDTDATDGNSEWDIDIQTTAGGVTTDSTPRRPVLVEAPERMHLFWTAHTDDGWPLFHATIGEDMGDPERLTVGNAPPLDVTGCRTDNGVSVAWTAAGRSSEIRICSLTDGEWTSVETVSSDCDAAYDAAIAPAADEDNADRYLIYTALRDGWYDVVGRSLVDGEWSNPQILSRQPGLAAYPTIVASSSTGSRSNGSKDDLSPVGPTGVWVAWVSYTPGETSDIRPYVNHQRREDQHAPFRGSRAIYIHHWDGESVRTPVYDRDWAPVTEANDISGIVPPAEGGTRPALLGGDALRLVWLDYEHQQDRPRLAVSRFTGDRWTDPQYGPIYGDAERIHHALVDGTPTIAAGRDTRPMGGWDHFETEEHDGRCEVGRVSVASSESSTSELTLRQQNRWVHDRRDARNPAVDATSRTDRELVFLNLHRHTDLSVCQRAEDGELDFNVRIARDLVREDAIAVTDHCYNSDALTRFKTDRAAAFYDQSSLVTIPSYEWTGTHRTVSGEHYGHFNVHWFEGGLPPLGVPNSGIKPQTPDALAETLDDHQAVAIPHHTANRSHFLRPDLFDLPNAPVVEVFQATRGTCEERDGPGATEFSDVDDERCYIRHALNDDVRLGFVGGGDHRGIALTGVWVDEVSRAGIYDALRERRCFATTGTTLALETFVDGTSMGEVHHPPQGADSVEYAIDVTAPDGVDTIQIIRDGDVIHSFGSGEHLEATVEVDRDPTRRQYLYARLLLSNGEVAWASPTWISADS